MLYSFYLPLRNSCRSILRHDSIYLLLLLFSYYNLHQTLKTNISILNSFTGMSLISAASAGLVFFISFTSFFLIIIISPFELYPIVSLVRCQGCLLPDPCCLLLDPRSSTTSVHTFMNWIRAQVCCLSYANMWRLLLQSWPGPTRLATWSSLFKRANMCLS